MAHLRIVGTHSSPNACRVLVWIGDAGGPLDTSRQPTYDSGGWVGLPWQPGVDAKLAGPTLAQGSYAVQIMVVERFEDGSFRVFAGEQETRVPAGEARQAVELRLDPIRDFPQAILSEPRRVSIPMNQESEVAPKLILLLVRDR